jgi:ferritin-like metal-binding protein YciE
MKTTTIDQLLVEELKDIYDAEKQLVKALPKMAKAASDSQLKEAFNTHLEETKGHVERLNEVFAAIGVKAAGKPCAAMKGLVAEGGEAMEFDADEGLRDAVIIGAAQRVEHYEMAAYGTARALAEHLGNTEVVDLLQQTLDEEKEADEKLTTIAMDILSGMSGSDGASNGARSNGRASARPRTREAGSSATF